MSNGWIRELCGVTKGVDERIDESFFLWFGHTKRMVDDWIAKRVHMGEYIGNSSWTYCRKRWNDSVNECLKLKKRGLDVGQTRRIVQGRNKWPKFVRASAWG